MFILVLEQVIKFFCFMMLGFIFRKTGLLSADTTKVLSKLEVNLFLPAVIFNSFSQNFTVANLKLNFLLIIVSVCVVIISIIISTILARFFTKDAYQRKVVTYAMVVPNVSYVGIPLIMSLYGNDAVMRVLIFMLPNMMYTSTEGYRLLLDKKNRSFTSLLNMQIFAILFGILFGLFNLKIPSLVTEVITGCSNCLSPIAMILTGCVIAEFSIKKILSSLLVYKVVFARMIILPLIFISLAKFINLLPEIIFAIVAVQTMPTALNTVIFPASVGKDCNLGAGMACVSNILAIVLLPLSFYIFL